MKRIGVLQPPSLLIGKIWVPVINGALINDNKILKALR